MGETVREMVPDTISSHDRHLRGREKPRERRSCPRFFPVTFAPEGIGTRSATMYIFDSAGDSAQAVTLTGTGQ
jgi:hypothetical protein